MIPTFGTQKIVTSRQPKQANSPLTPEAKDFLDNLMPIMKIDKDPVTGETSLILTPDSFSIQDPQNPGTAFAVDFTPDFTKPNDLFAQPINMSWTVDGYRVISLNGNKENGGHVVLNGPHNSNNTPVGIDYSTARYLSDSYSRQNVNRRRA